MCFIPSKLSIILFNFIERRESGSFKPYDVGDVMPVGRSNAFYLRKV